MSEDFATVKQQVRLVQLVDAAERAALAPIGTDKLHAFAYLSDVLSPVWGLLPFERRIVKTGRAPYYPDMQRELDSLVAMGFVEVCDLRYERLKDKTLVFKAKYALNFQSEACQAVLRELALDPDARVTQSYLDELARALGSLKDDDISAAATEDATYRDPMVESGDVINFDTARSLRTSSATNALEHLFPGVTLTPSRRLFMYAHYLGRKVHVAG